MYDVVIIGAGASGVMCALALKSHNPCLNVLVLEKNDKIGKKLLMTGNGKCNLGNTDLSLDHYFSNDSLKDFINVNEEYYDYLKRFGVIIKESEGRLYPYSMQALTVCKSFERALEQLDVKIKYGYDVNNVNKVDDTFIIDNKIKTKRIVVATGGKTYPKTGSSGKGYEILKSFGHHITKLYPSLTSLKTSNKYIKDLEGVRVDANAYLVVDESVLTSDQGQVQFTKDSVSGICVFNLSRNVGKLLHEGKSVYIVIDVIPDYDISFISNIIRSYDYRVEEALSCILNNKLAAVIAKHLKYYGRMVKELSDEELLILSNMLKSLKFKIVDTGDFDISQVTNGGACITEFSQNLESKIVDGLYAIGEVIDVDGKCGGYNLAWAFTSALIVSKDIASK